MPITIRDIHPCPADAPQALNAEWFLLENASPTPFAAKGCSVSVSRRHGGASRPREIGKLDPGFVLAPGETIRIVTGSPATKLHGAPPPEEGGVKNYYLMLRQPLVAGAGTTLHVSLRQHELARATWEGGAAGTTQAERASSKKGA